MPYYLGSLPGGAVHILATDAATEHVNCGAAAKLSDRQHDRWNGYLYPTLGLALRAARSVSRVCRHCIRSAERQTGITQPKVVRRRSGSSEAAAAQLREVARPDLIEIAVRGLTPFAFNAGVTIEGAERLLLATDAPVFRLVPCTSVACADANADHLLLAGAFGGRDLLYCTECGLVDLWL